MTMLCSLLEFIFIFSFLCCSDSYVKGKLGKATIPGHHRCDLCELAIEEHESTTKSEHWLSVSRAESEYYDGFIDFPEVTTTLSQFLNSVLFGAGKLLKYPLYVIYVCGLDHFNKCPDVLHLARNKFIKCAVVYRKGCDERRIRTLDESSNIIYVPLDNQRKELTDVSSTEIRARLKDSKDNLNQLTYDSVIRHMKRIQY